MVKSDNETIEQMEKDMDMIFNNVKGKVINRRHKKGNTTLPWIDFTTEHLSNRLDDEWLEWKESNQSHELIDIIAMAVFLKLSIFYDTFDTDEKEKWKWMKKTQ